jgi:hypothetical protein
VQIEDKRIDLKDEFNKFWIKVCRKHNLNKNLKDAVWKHIVALKITEVKDFINGLKSFGFNIKEK